jgi:hypothetical protein
MKNTEDTTQKNVPVCSFEKAIGLTNHSLIISLSTFLTVPSEIVPQLKASTLTHFN